MGLPTLYDLAQRVGKNNAALGKIIELQSQTNELFQYLPLKQCNNGTMEKALVRASLPPIAWRLLNQGTKPTKSSTTQVSFSTGGVEAFADIDERQMQLNKNSNEWRLGENYAHQEAMAQKMATTFFYGDEKKNPAGFTGLSAYYYAKTGVDKVYSDQIIDAGGTGDNLTSLWICTFAEDTVYGIYPEGITAGYKYQDKGLVELKDADGGVFYGYRSQYNWDMGLALRDPRYVVRIANINTSDFSSNNFIRNIIKGMEQIHNIDHGKTVLMCNRQVRTYLSILAGEKSNVNLSINDFGGKRILNFWGKPIIINDAILNTESKIE